MASKHDPNRLSPRAAATRLDITIWAVKKYCEAFPHIAQRIEHAGSPTGWRYSVNLAALVAVMAAHPRRRWPRPPSGRAPRSQAVAHAVR